MKAYVLHGIGDLRYEDVDEPKLNMGEVLVEVKSAGICGSDIPRIYQTGTYHFPTIPGHEFSGIVKSVYHGENDAVSNNELNLIGKRIGIFPLIPCHKCIPCKKGQFEMCRNYSYLGSRTDGGFAQYVAVPAANLIELPDSVSFEAAAMLEPMAVAVHAMRSINPGRDETVAVLGLGTIGLLLCMFLREAGIKNILVIGNKNSQKEYASELGIKGQQFCDMKNQDVNEWIKEKTQNQGVDVFFECVGKNETVSQAILNTSPGGRVQLIGNPASDMILEKNIYWKILRNQLTVKGSWNSSFTLKPEDDWHYVLEKIDSKQINPERFITQKLSFEELEKGLHIMRDKTEDYVKVMVCR